MSIINKEDLRWWIENNLNVALIGSHGIGKSLSVLNIWKEMGIVGRYVHAPTLDVFCDLIGIPRVLEDDKGHYVDFIKPRHLNYSELECLFVDELTRASKKVRDAVLELIQFKSLNGVPVPKLKSVIVAFNPQSSGGISYDVDELDPALLDRFQIIQELGFDCDVEYFRNKYGKIADGAVEWWREIPEDIRRAKLSPRRLDYLLDVYQKGGDINWCIDKSINGAELLRRIDNGSVLDQIKKLIKENKDNKTEKFISNHHNRDLVLKYMEEDTSYEEYFLRFLPSENLVSYWTTQLGDKEEGKVGPRMLEVDTSQGKALVHSVSVSVAKNLAFDKFRARINTIFGAKKNSIIERVSQDINRILCPLNVTLNCPPSRLMPPTLGGNLDFSHYIDQCLMVNSIHAFIQEGRGDEMSGAEVKDVLERLHINNKTTSKSSCIYKKINAIRTFYEL